MTGDAESCKQPRAQKPQLRASRHGELPRYDATGLAGLVPRRDIPGGLRRDKGISGSSKPQIGDCCNALMIAAAAVADNPETPINRRSWAIIRGRNRPSAGHNDLTLIP